LILKENPTIFVSKRRAAMEKHADSIDAAILDRIRPILPSMPPALPLGSPRHSTALPKTCLPPEQ
jgi:hypothetical protein